MYLQNIILKMWSLYSSDHWPVAYDVKTAVMRIMSRLEDSIFDMRHAAIYDTDICFDNEAVCDLLTQAEEFNAGRNWCSRFVEDTIDLDQLCAEMEKLNLRSYLYELESFAPEYIVEKYKLGMDNDDSISEPLNS